VPLVQRAELFDLAVTRAATYLDRLRPGWRAAPPPAPELAAILELWYLRTRFAYRIPLEQVVGALEAAAATSGSDDPLTRG